jgi:hypothetical protein
MSDLFGTKPEGILASISRELHSLEMAASNGDLYKKHLDKIDEVLGLDKGRYAPSMDDRISAIRKLQEREPLDNTAAASSATGSTFSLFPGVAVGQAAYFGNTTRQFPGVNVLLPTKHTASPLSGLERESDLAVSGPNPQDSDPAPLKANMAVRTVKPTVFELGNGRLTIPSGHEGVVVHDEYIEPPPSPKIPLHLQHLRARSVWVRFAVGPMAISLEKSVFVSDLLVL